MNIIFLGTSDFCLPSLNAIKQSKHKLLAVVTQPDKIRARGHKVLFTPVKEFGLQNKLPVLQPEKLKDPNFIEQLKSFDADLFVVAAYRILPKEVFTLPKYGSFNLHGSLLPQYRGAAPIQWSLINGDRSTGLTTFALAEQVDTGNMFIQKPVEIFEDDDFETLHDRMAVIGADLVIETIEIIEKGNYNLIKQEDTAATPAPKITKEMCLLNWDDSAEKIKNLIRGLSPLPGAYMVHNGKQIKIFKSKINNEINLGVGEFYSDKQNLIVGCNKSSLEILELQLEGKKRLDVESFLRGYKF